MTKKKWDKSTVLSEIKKLHANGEPLNTGHIIKDNDSLYQAAIRHWGGWKNALEELKIPYESVMKRKEWGKDKVIDTILSYHKEGIDLSSRAIRKYDHSLYSVARHHYNAWDNAMNKAGLDYDAIKKRKYRSKEWVLNQIKNRYYKNENLTADYINTKHGALMNGARKRFGSWEKAVETAIGVNYKEEIKRPPGTPSIWNEITIPEKIIELNEKGEDISYKAMWRAGYQSLIAQSNLIFGGYGAAIENAGIDYNKVMKIQKWGNEEAVIQAIKDLKEAKEPLNAMHIRIVNNKLMNAANRYFGGWENAIRKAGLNYDKIRTREEWESNRILDEIKIIGSGGHSLKWCETYQDHSKLLDAARNYFGGWKNAVEKAGFEYKSYNKLEIELGNELEEIAREIFIDVLGFNYEFKQQQPINNKIPDFIDRDTGTWIDSKLSAWSPGIKRDIRDYSPYTKRLKFVYLLGKPPSQGGSEEYPCIIEYQCINDYKDDLVEHDRDDLIEKLRMIEKKVLPSKQRQLNV